MEDSAPNLKTVLEKKDTDSARVVTGAKPRLRLTAKHDAMFPMTIVGSLTGMLVGTLPAALWVLISGVPFSPLYVFLPLCIYWGIKSFKGYTDRRGFALICIFTVIGFYLAILSCAAAAYVTSYKMLFFNLPLVTITLIGNSDVFAGPIISSVYIFPLLFTILGVLLSHELLLHKNGLCVVSEPGIETVNEKSQSS